MEICPGSLAGGGIGAGAGGSSICNLCGFVDHAAGNIGSVEAFGA